MYIITGFSKQYSIKYQNLHLDVASQNHDTEPLGRM